jgi:hypothetical protein
MSSRLAGNDRTCGFDCGTGSRCVCGRRASFPARQRLGAAGYRASQVPHFLSTRSTGRQARARARYVSSRLWDTEMEGEDMGPDSKDKFQSSDAIERMEQDTDSLILASKRLAEELQALAERVQKLEAKQSQILERIKQPKKDK